MGVTLEFGLEDFGLCDWALRCFIPVFKVHDSSFYVCVVLGFGSIFNSVRFSFSLHLYSDIQSAGQNMNQFWSVCFGNKDATVLFWRSDCPVNTIFA